MAESSLDDFFAKKDKSKKKSKTTKLTPDDILAKSDEPVKKDKKSKKEKTKSQTPKSTTDINSVPDAEWLEVEDEKETDYTGLRIANLQVGDKDQDTGDEEVVEENGEEYEDGETREKKDTGQQGPWNVKATPNPTTPAPAPVEVPSAPKDDSTPKAPTKYIPPAQRAAAAAAASGGGSSMPSGPTVPAHLRRKRVAPNITSEQDFPTLGGGAPAPPPHDSDSRSFEKVHYGGKQMEDPTKLSQQLSLGNKYAALQD